MMDMLIGGKHISSEDLVDVVNPYNGDVLDTVPIAHRQTADLAILEANNAKSFLQEMSAFKVSNKLFNVCDKLKDYCEDFAELLTLEVGKPINESLVEMDRSIETLKLAAEEAKRIYGESVPLDAGLNGKGFFAFTQKVPLGVVAAITPFNYPLNLTIHKIAPAIACKNTVIIKPPTEAPLTVMKFAELLNEEFPDGVVNTVTGYGSEVGDYLVTSADVNKISFTGSVTTGLMISQKAGMKKVTLELGGNDPLIVLKDANVDNAVKGVINGAFLNAGQVCMGVKRIIVDNEIADEFCEKLVLETEKLVMGNPLDDSTTLGTLINEKAAIQVEESVKDYRLNFVQSVQEKIAYKKNNKLVGKTLKVLVDSFNPKYKFFVGRGYFSAPEVDFEIWFKSYKQISIGSFVDVTITKFIDGCFIGEVL